MAIKEKTIMMGLGIIGVGLTAAILANDLLNQPPPGIFQAQPKPASIETSGPSWSQQHAMNPELLGGVQGQLTQASGGQRPSPISPRAMRPTLIGGTQGYVSNVSGPGRILGPGTGVVFFTQATLPRNERETPVAIY